MDNFNNKDKKIKETLAQDKFITDSNKNVINNYIPNEQIKPKKISQAQKSLFIFILIILLLAIAFVLYLYENSSDSDLADSPKEFEESISLVDKTYNGTNTVTNLPANETTNNSNTVNNIPSDTLNLEDFRDFLNSYAYAINRLTNLNNDELEKNTIYIYIAMKYFDSQSIKTASLDTTNTQFAKTQDNINKFIYDISGSEITGTLPTYVDYVTYSTFANSYDYGVKSNILEQYNCTDVQIARETDSGYNVTAKITRTTLDTKADYEVSINVTLNENFTYVPYRITSIVSTNLSEPFDTTFHLVNLYDLSIEEINLAKENMVTFLNRANQNSPIDYTILIDSIESLDNGSYRFYVTVCHIGNEQEKIEKNYTATASRKMNNISIDNMDEV